MFKFRKIASVLASAVMLSSTVALAAAANYPAPFVKSGMADVAIVYGTAQVGGTDILAATEIQTSLSSAMLSSGASTTSTSTSTTVSGGDYVKLEKSSTKFHLGNGILDVISGTLTDDDLPNLLADGVYSDDDNTEYDYTQKIVLANTTLTMFEDNDYAPDLPTVGMKIASADHILNYTLDFTDNVPWDQVETTNLNILGKEYYVLDSDMPTNSSLTLLDSSQSTLLAEGQSKSMSINGKSYDVLIDFISSTEVKFTINGQTTNTIAEGQTFKLKDGSYIGVKDILYNSKDTGISSVEFSIGSGKLILAHGQDVEINDDSISRLKTYFTTSSGKITKLVIEWKADNDVFIADNSTTVMPGFGALKIGYGGISFPTTEDIEVEAGSDDYMVLKNFPLKDSTEDITFLYGSNGNWAGIGKDSDDLLRTTNSSSMTFDGDTDEYFVVSWADSSSSESYLMKATSFKTESSGSINKTTFQYKKDGSWADAKEDRQNTDVFTIGNAELTVGQIDYNGKTVVFTAGSGVSFNTLYSNEGLKVYLPYSVSNNANATSPYPGAINFQVGNTGNASVTSGHNATAFNLAFIEEDKNENVASGTPFNLSLGWNTATTKQATVSDIVGESVTPEEQGNSDIFETYMYSSLASKILWDKSGDQYSAMIEYHGDEASANVYVTAPDAVISGSNGGSTTLGNVVVMDSEVASVDGKNLIVVGGSCVNTVAASLLGSTSPLCGAGFTTTTGVANNQYLIQTFSRTGGKVATLVAGYNAIDTTNAAKYLTTQTVDTTEGKKYVGTTATNAAMV